MSLIIAVTGTSKGIGKEIFSILQQEGHTVYGSSRNPTGDDAYELKLDVSSDESVRKFIGTIIEKEGHIDVLINNAGYGLAGPLVETDIGSALHQFDVNFFGVHRMVLATIPHMRRRGKGRIITIGSIADRLPIPYQGFYAASKAALALYSDGLRIELKKDKIDVCLVEPGDTKTEFSKGRVFPENFDPEAHPDAMKSLEVMEKDEHNGTDPRKVAKLVRKLVKARRTKPRYTTGIDAWLVSRLLRILPFGISEFLIMKYYKVRRK